MIRDPIFSYRDISHTPSRAPAQLFLLVPTRDLEPATLRELQEINHGLWKWLLDLRLSARTRDESALANFCGRKEEGSQRHFASRSDAA
jgi:hypothetical protein